MALATTMNSDFSFDRIREEDLMNIALDAPDFEYPRSYSSDLEHGMLTLNETVQVSKSKANSCGIVGRRVCI